MPKVIFISGIHGSGKTTLGNKLSEKLGIPFTSASSIIKRMSVQNWDNEKKVTDITQNQNVLYEGIKKFYPNCKTLILDGHFTLLDKKNSVTCISTEIYSMLNISLIIACTAEPNIIVERLKARDDNTNVNEHLLNTFQIEENKHASSVAKQLNIQIIFHDTNKNSEENLVEFIKKVGI